MGLVLLELTLRIEKTFNIQIPDNVAYKLTTPGKVTDYILTQVGESQFPLPCLSQRVFHLLRRSFIEHLSLPPHQFRLNTALKEIVPEKNRDEIWKDIGLSIGVKIWPGISRPTWLTFIPSRVQSVRDLVEFLVTNEPLAIKGDECEWSRAQVWGVLRRNRRHDAGEFNDLPITYRTVNTQEEGSTKHGYSGSKKATRSWSRLREGRQIQISFTQDDISCW